MSRASKRPARVPRRPTRTASGRQPWMKRRWSWIRTRTRAVAKSACLRKQGLRNLGLARQEPEASRSVEEVQLRETPVSDAAPAQAADAETAAFVTDVRRRLAALEGQNAYARLGVTSNASQEQIKQAYLGAAKKYHPDRAAATPGLGGILPELQKLFSALKEAHDHIGTAPARAKYDQQLRHGATGKMSSKKEEAALEVKMGEVLLKRRDFEGALKKLRHAVELTANADALPALAWRTA